jgi:hypothetical protein
MPSHWQFGHLQPKLWAKEGGGLLPSPGRGESCVSKCPWQVPTPKGVPNAKLTSRGWFWMQIQA